MKKVKKITVYFKGAFYGHDFFDCKTIKELLQNNKEIKRNHIQCFIKEYY